MKVICYGDSNTYGFDPRSFLGGRYDADSRWVDILAGKTNWILENRGMNGRTIPRGPLILPSDTDLLIVMLGTNDLLEGCSADVIGESMENLLRLLTLKPDQILLVAPVPLKPGAWVSSHRMIENSIRLAENYRKLSERLKIRFLSAYEWNVDLAFDGVHFTAEGHRSFAAGLYEALADWKLI